MSTQKKYRLKADRLGHKAGTICYPYNGCDYGLCSDDARATGVEHTAMVLFPGCLPFFTVPVSDIEEVTE